MSEPERGHVTAEEVLAVLKEGEECSLPELRARVLVARGYGLTGEALQLAAEMDFTMRDVAWDLVGKRILEFTTTWRVRRRKVPPDGRGRG